MITLVKINTKCTNRCVSDDFNDYICIMCYVKDTCKVKSVFKKIYEDLN